MVRALVGYSVLAVIGIIALKLIFGLLGFAFKLLWAGIWLAALGFIFYLVLKIISPTTAARVREKIQGDDDE
jgi:hypothetical protein